MTARIDAAARTTRLNDLETLLSSDGDFAGGQSVGIGGNRDGTGCASGLHDGQHLAAERRSTGALERGGVGLIAVVHANDLAGPRNGERNIVVGSGDEDGVTHRWRAMSASQGMFRDPSWAG